VLIIYAVIVPLAVMVGYMLTNPLDYSSAAIYGLLALVLVLPLLLRWHFLLMLATWNMSAVVFLLKGAPTLGMVTMVMSLTISVLERILDRERHFLRVPQISWSLICMIGVVFFTAKMTGGFGFRAFGSDVYGGKKYIFALAGIMGYFAITARRIPLHQAKLALALFFLSGLTAVFSDVVTYAPPGFSFIGWLFPPNLRVDAGLQWGLTRLGSSAAVSGAVVSYMLAIYGIRGIFSSGRPWRIALFVLSFCVGLLGGYRVLYISLGGAFLIQFFLEGLHRTKLLPIFAFVALCAAVALFSVTPKLPFTVQRSLAFLPLPVDPVARASAQDSVEWREDMWKALMPQVPKYLIVGKGYGFSSLDFQYMAADTAFHTSDAAQGSLALAGDYHNGWISVLITFGIWGMITFVWFAVAGVWALYYNYRYGDPALRVVNSFLLATLVVRIGLFLSVSGGGLHSDMLSLVGILGLGIALNGGVAQPVVERAEMKQLLRPVKPFPRPRPVFQRYRADL